MNHAVTSHAKKVIYIPGRYVFINVCVLIHIVYIYILFIIVNTVYMKLAVFQDFLGW